MSATWTQREGAVVDGQFHLGGYLGGSGRTAVFRTEFGEHEAAIKLIPADSRDAESWIARWKHAVHLNHPHLVRLYRTGRCQLGGTPMLYAVMEFAGENLGEILPQRALAPEEVREMLSPLLDALTYLHRKGFAHGRMKPANILVVDENVKLASDGLLAFSESAPRFEKPGPYDPPEAPAHANTAAADIWALGATIVEALTLRLPVRDTKTQDDPALPDSIPQTFREIARRALRFSPEARCSLASIRLLLDAPPGSISSVPAPLAPELKAAAASAVKAAAKPAAKAEVKPAPKVERKPERKSEPPKASIPAPTTRAGAKKAASQTSYIVSAVIAAVIIAAIYIVPRIPNRSSNSAQVSTPAASASTADAPGSRAPASPASSTNAPSGAAHDTAAAGATPPSHVKAEKPAPRAAASRPASRSTAQPSSATADSQILAQVEPDVSQRALATIQGKVRVVLKMSVDASGSVTGASVESAASQYFAERAIAAARQWKFVPASANGQNVPSEWAIRFDFRRSETKVSPQRVAP